ncbi:formyl peptide receptor-like 1 inhibitory protein [Staphylococcus aureus]|uniref:Formyl peptide receptor-like 1 inhibitory protein n=1 Tax=Staphylococcus aureus TaxID=1280 RepID=A0A380DP17_STAAU|nr:formyl peptide receptor-like 1 inhibitory protein [Staphylococcus aureus]
MGKGNTIAVVKIKDGGKNGYYTFDITRPLEEHRKIFQWLKTVKSIQLVGIN